MSLRLALGTLAVGIVLLIAAATYGIASAQNSNPIPPPASSGSVVLNKNFAGFEGRALLAAADPGINMNRISSPQISIRYSTQVTDDAGVIIPSGSTVPAGTKLRFVFSDPQRTDIGWFLIGGTFGSPYGIWRAGATSPTRTELCAVGTLTGKRNSSSGSARFRETGIYVVAPPERTLAGMPGSSCTATAGNGRVCTVTLNEPGTFEAAMNYGETNSSFYVIGWREDLNPTCAQHVAPNASLPGHVVSWGSAGTPTSEPPWTMGASPLAATQGDITKYTVGSRANWEGSQGVNVFTGIPVPPVSIPFTVNVLASEATGTPPTDPNLVAAGGQCVVGQPHAISMTSTDPDGDQIKFGIDWDGDGFVDQAEPSSGYVASGSTQQVSRTFATAGEKTVKVRATDINGLSSGWSTLSFNCTAGEDDGNNNNSGNENGDGSGENNSNNNNGNTNNTGNTSSSPDVSIRAIPSLVANGQTTKIHWESSRAESCEVDGNGDHWEGLASPVNGETSNPITGRVTYVLSCLGVDGVTRTDRATVWTLPIWQES